MVGSFLKRRPCRSDLVMVAEHRDESAWSIPAPTSGHMGLLAVAAAALLPMVFWVQAYHVFWAPKAAICLIILGPGLVALARLVRSGDRSAVLAALFLATSVVSALLSGNLPMALVGAANWGTGLLFVAVLAAAWAMGRASGARRRAQMVVAILAAASANAVVAWLQARGLVPPGLDSPGRAAGLLGNPVHLGALLAGALWLVGQRVGRQGRSFVWLVPLGLMAGAAQLSGSRAATVLALVALLASTRGARHWRKVALVLAAAVGLALAPVGAKGAVLASARSVAADAKDAGVRDDLWPLGMAAFGERPVLGWGPGRFEAATSPRYDPSIVETGVFEWPDAHNWVVEYAVTTGLLGVGLLAGWLATAARRSRGPLAGFALVTGLFLFLEPQTVALTPLVLLALGAAGPAAGWPRRGAPGWAWASTALMGAGVVAAGTLMVGETFMQRGFLDSSVTDMRRASRLLPAWPEVSLVEARATAFHSLGGAGAQHRPRVLSLARQATRRDPTDATSWAHLGAYESKWGSAHQADTALRRSLDRNPWMAVALHARADLARRRGDTASLAESCARIERLRRASTACSSAVARTP